MLFYPSIKYELYAVVNIDEFALNTSIHVLTLNITTLPIVIDSFVYHYSLLKSILYPYFALSDAVNEVLRAYCR